MLSSLHNLIQRRLGIGLSRPGLESDAQKDILFFDDDPKLELRPAERVLVSALGSDIHNRDAQLRTIADAVSAKHQLPILLVNDARADYLVSCSFPVETLPTRADLRTLSDTEYASYTRHKWRVLLAKWAIKSEIPLGLDIDEFLSEQLAGSTGGSPAPSVTSA